MANDIAVSPKGDLYVIHQNTGIVHIAEDKAKPAAANVPGKVTVTGGVAKIAYTLQRRTARKVAQYQPTDWLSRLYIHAT